MSDRLNGYAAVMTGDVVGWTDLDPDAASRLPSVLEALAAAAADFGAEALVDVFRGDGWQMLVRPASAGLRVALLVRAGVMHRLEGADVRAALALGAVEAAPRARISQGRGEAFVRSGRGLDAIGDRRLAFDAADERGRLGWDAAMSGLDGLIAAAWTPKRAAAVEGALRGWTQRRTGASWRPPVTQANIAGLLARARWPDVERMCALFERWARDGGAGV